MPQETTDPALRAAEARVEDLLALAGTRTDPTSCPHAARIVREVPVYDCTALRVALRQHADLAETLKAEWAQLWAQGPGIVVLQSALGPDDGLDAVTRQFQAMIVRERETRSGGDHFAQAGANDRVWNALEKLCLADPAAFARYYANDMIALASLAWLGPGYQITSQVNNVRPGGAAQAPHRDYHLGFCTPEEAERYPAHVHRLSPALTLQGAVAHVDMPVESGPTLYLPHSQKFTHGYLVAQREDFRRAFEAHHVQLPLARGDAVFFNPALLHAAGSNRSSDIQRLANLLQVSSPFGRAMEAVDRHRMSRALYPHLLVAQRSGAWTEAALHRAVAACAEGYAFPTNLDLDPPIGGLAPETPQRVLMRALRENWPPSQLDAVLDAMAHKRLS